MRNRQCLMVVPTVKHLLLMCEALGSTSCLMCKVCGMEITQITDPLKPSNFKNCLNYFSVSVKRQHDQSDLFELIESLQFQRVEVNGCHGKEHGCRQAGSRQQAGRQAGRSPEQ